MKPFRYSFSAFCRLAVLLTVICALLVFRPDIILGRGSLFDRISAEYAGDYEEPEEAVELIYCNAFDGYAEIHETASWNGATLGKFYNGTDTATIVSVDGDWTQIDCKGIVGWIRSSYVSYEETKPVTSGVDADWLEGIWYDGVESVLLIYNNGAWELGDGTPTSHGRYFMENNDIIFTPTWSLYDDLDPFTIDLSNSSKTELVGDYYRIPYASSREEVEYSDGGDIMITKSDFKKRGRKILAEIEKE